MSDLYISRDSHVVGTKAPSSKIPPLCRSFIIEASIPLQVRSVPVKAKKIAFEEMKVPPTRVKEISTVEPSMRLDAVASAAFGMAREKMADRIKAGDVQLNWDTVKRTDIFVAVDDTISCKGKGRAVVKSVKMTQKKRFAVHLIRYT